MSDELYTTYVGPYLVAKTEVYEERKWVGRFVAIRIHVDDRTSDHKYALIPNSNLPNRRTHFHAEVEPGRNIEIFARAIEEEIVDLTATAQEVFPEEDGFVVEWGVVTFCQYTTFGGVIA